MIKCEDDEVEVDPLFDELLSLGDGDLFLDLADGESPFCTMFLTMRLAASAVRVTISKVPLKAAGIKEMIVFRFSIEELN